MAGQSRQYIDYADLVPSQKQSIWRGGTTSKEISKQSKAIDVSKESFLQTAERTGGNILEFFGKATEQALVTAGEGITEFSGGTGRVIGESGGQFLGGGVGGFFSGAFEELEPEIEKFRGGVSKTFRSGSEFISGGIRVAILVSIVFILLTLARSGADVVKGFSGLIKKISG